MQRLLGILVFITLMSVIVGTVMAQTMPVITIDENGHGTLNGNPLHWGMGPDPGPGGLQNVLWYSAMNHLVGDLWIHEVPGIPSDVVRFNPDGMIFFYSDAPLAGAEVEDVDLADVGLPATYYPNPIVMIEQGSEGNNWVDYTPGPNDPGYAPDLPGLTYHIISDVPEPSTLILLGAGIISLLVFAWRRR